MIHSPSVYDFRDRDDVLFAYLSNSDSVHVSPIFEMPPVGIFALEQHANRQGYKAQFFNVASRMLRDPEFDVAKFFRSIPARVVGFDLHWLVHSHGSVELARLYKKIHPEAKVVFGGIASTFFHQQLIQYPQVDYVIRGYDTLMPLERLLASKNEPELLQAIPNLSWKRAGEVHHNAMDYVPRVYSAAVDWSKVFTADRRGMTPYNLVIPQAGCEYNCKWCGGSRYFFSKYMGLTKGPARVHKAPEALRAEFESIQSSARGRHTLTTIDFWHEYDELFSAAESVFLDNTRTEAQKGNSVTCLHYSLHRLPPIEKAIRMSKGIQAVIELSPDSHDLEVAKASGRGTYTMERMEAFIDELIGKVYSFEIYFMIGLPKQTAQSVLDTADYCAHLLKKYRGKNVYPFICPMLPFLDPGSEIFDSPDEHGYMIRHHTLEEHRQALVSLNWRDRLNFETKWMTRTELVDVSYESVRRLTLSKVENGFLPESFGQIIVDRIDETRNLLGRIDAMQALPDGPAKDAEHKTIRQAVGAYNREQLKAVMSQQRPVDVGFARQQWSDTDEAIDAALSAAG